MGSQRGFSLAEVLVVSAIIAIMAAVAIPVYSGYVQAQRLETVQNLAQTAAVAANAYYRRHNNPPPDSASLGLFLPVAGKYGISVNATSVTVTDLTNPSTLTSTVNYR